MRWLMPSIARRRPLKRSAPSPRLMTTCIVHLSPTRESTSVTVWHALAACAAGRLVTLGQATDSASRSITGTSMCPSDENVPSCAGGEAVSIWPLVINRNQGIPVMNILRVDTAVTGSESVSRQITQALTDHYRALFPDAEVVELDLATDPLPHIDAVTTGAIRLPAERQDAAMRSAAPAERAVVEQFLASDIVIVGAPMYKFTIPSSLKAWLDRLGVPGLTYRYSEAGPEGLAGGRTVIVSSSQGGA